MKTLLSTLILGAGLVLGGCGNNSEGGRIEYTIQDTINNNVLTYKVVKEKDFYLLDVKGNIDNKYNKIHFGDINNSNSLLKDGNVMFYKNGYKDGTSISDNGSVAVGLWEDKTEFYNKSDNSKLSQAIVKEAKKQIENYFEPLYRKLRVRVEERHKKGIGIIPIVKVVNQDSIINEKIKELF